MSAGIDLAGRTVVVTGGNGGIGLATVEAMVLYGARVISADMAHPEARTKSDHLAVTPADVSDEQSVVELFDFAERTFGPVGVLVNNAGVDVVGDVVATGNAEFRRVLDINLTGVFLCSREFVRRHSPGNEGAIVNTASINGYYPDRESVAYSTSKGGVIALTKAMALDHLGNGIRVNCVCPGWIRTPMSEPYLTASNANRDFVEGLHLLGRVGEPAEV